MKPLQISSWSKITNHGMWHNGELLISFSESENAHERLKSAYTKLGFAYPKFFKMDGLCKLALLGSETLLTPELKSKYADDEIAILLSNSHSSLQSDSEHYQKFSNGTASPAIFVYTLPNIAIGEICIRHKLLGESNFYIFESFAPEALLEQAQLLINTTATRACLTGWVEFYKDTFEAVFFLLENQDGEPASTKLMHTIKDTTN